MSTVKTAVFALGLGALATFSPLRADGRLEPPVPVRITEPVFPYALRREGVSGVVLVNCLIDAQGNVREATVKEASQDGFVQPALAALKKWKFKPAQRDGANVPIRVCIPIKFTIDDS